MQKELYKFIGKYIDGVPEKALIPALEEFEKIENENNRIIPIMEQKVFPFLLANGIEPIVISGSPQEPLELYEKRMKFKSVYGIKYDLQEETYTDRCNVNTAIAEGKSMIIQRILEENPDAKIIFGFGDSEADIPILESAELGFINNSNKFLDKTNMHYLDFYSPEAGEQIIELMTQELARLDRQKI